MLLGDARNTKTYTWTNFGMDNSLVEFSYKYKFSCFWASPVASYEGIGVLTFLCLNLGNIPKLIQVQRFKFLVAKLWQQLCIMYFENLYRRYRKLTWIFGRLIPVMSSSNHKKTFDPDQLLT